MLFRSPHRLILHTNVWQGDDVFEEARRLFTEVYKFHPAEEIDGVSLDYPQYQADVKRLQVLRDIGGIYLDTDMFMIRSVDEFRNNRFVMGIEGEKDGEIEALSNALMMSEQGSPIITKWLQKIPEYLRKNIWAAHAVNLPVTLIDEYKDAFTVLPQKAFVPFDLKQNYLFSNIDEHLLDEAYAVHAWETYFKSYEISDIVNKDYMMTSDSLFARTFRKYAD